MPNIASTYMISVQAARQELQCRMHLEAACRAAFVRIILHDVDSRTRTVFGPDTASVFAPDGSLRELVCVGEYFTPVVGGRCQPVSFKTIIIKFVWAQLASGFFWNPGDFIYLDIAGM